MGPHVFYTLPLMEGIVGFGVLGVTLVTLSWLDKKGIVTVDEGKIAACLFIGSMIGIGFLLFKSIALVGL